MIKNDMQENFEFVSSHLLIWNSNRRFNYDIAWETCSIHYTAFIIFTQVVPLCRPDKTALFIQRA